MIQSVPQRAALAVRAQSELERKAWAKVWTKLERAWDDGVNDLITAAVEYDRRAALFNQRANPGLWHRILHLVAKVFPQTGRSVDYNVWRRFINLVPNLRLKERAELLAHERAYTVTSFCLA